MSTFTNSTSGLFSASCSSFGNRRRQAEHQGAKKSTTTSCESLASSACSASGVSADIRLDGFAPSHLLKVATVSRHKRWQVKGLAPN